MKLITQEIDFQADTETINLLRKLRHPEKFGTPTKLHKEIAKYYQKIGYSKQKSILLGRKFITDTLINSRKM